ncbi:hypothetical protein Dvina_16615 [Dactylosporangium vinaceum]|uniref:Secreted protein n=1 Tax=Dactylosporangium vinaceum TaxID=53362 RepID=A0ABV5M8Y2_9ACTN|nr:hypothetical protein [Dactylosporangium vinaceum]UAB99546.1 hypothetical protein Dvina_16615 [Dactylosporangium vinaceum]
MTRRLRQAGVAVLTVCAVILGLGVPAEATTIWELKDGFEGTESLWFRDGGGPEDCPKYRTCNPVEVIDNEAQAHRGTQYASILNNSGYGANWLSFGRRVGLPAGATQCQLTVWTNIDYARQTPVTISIDVFRADNRVYEMNKQVQLTDLSKVGTWRYQTTGYWNVSARDVVFRVVLVGQEWGVVGMRVDDLTVTCRVA